MASFFLEDEVSNFLTPTICSLKFCSMLFNESSKSCNSTLSTSRFCFNGRALPRKFKGEGRWWQRPFLPTHKYAPVCLHSHFGLSNMNHLETIERSYRIEIGKKKERNMTLGIQRARQICPHRNGINRLENIRKHFVLWNPDRNR